MKYTDINIGDKVAAIDYKDLVINKAEILGLEILRKFGRGDKLLLSKSTLRLTVDDGPYPKSMYFKLNGDGEVVEEGDYFVDLQIAQEELIIAKTKDYRTVYE